MSILTAPGLERTQSYRVETDNGCPAESTTGDATLSAFFGLLRGTAEEERREFVENMVADADAAALVDAFVLWAHIRDVRGGKGEREVGNQVFIDLAERFPATVEALLPSLVEYGSWADVFGMMVSVEGRGERVQWLKAALTAMAVGQLKADFAADRPSLAVKWAPREKCNDEKKKGLAKALAKEVFGGEGDARRRYRRALAEATERLGAPEPKMCSGRWSAVAPGSVPANCLLKHRRAFFNETKKGDARSDKEDRVECAKNFKQHVQSGKGVHGGVLHPHQMVEQYLQAIEAAWKARLSGVKCKEDAVLEAQWRDLRERELAKIEEAGGEGTERPRLVPMVDVSGSMYEDGRRPLTSAMGMGILTTEVTHPAFRDRFLTFSDKTAWHVLDPEASLLEKVKSTKGAGWGQSTDLTKAFELILETCVKANVPPEEVASLVLVVFSDMQFDAPMTRGFRYGPWETQHEVIVQMFRGAGYDAPHVVFWNLRANAKNFPVKGDTPGVTMLAGFSASQLRLLFDGDLAAMTRDKPEPAAPDPMQTMRKALDAERYDEVRRVCALMGEGAMAGYEAPTRQEKEEEEEMGEKAAVASLCTVHLFADGQDKPKVSHFTESVTN